MEWVTCSGKTLTAMGCVAMLLMHAAAAGAQGPANGEQRRAGPFRHYPGGKDLQGRRLARTSDATLEALRAEGDNQLPPGFHIRVDVAPAISPAGPNRIFRFGLDYQGVPLAAPADFVAIVAADGRLLSSRLRGLPETVDAAAPTSAAAAAVDTALRHARATTGAAAETLVADEPGLEIWTDRVRHGRLNWTFVMRASDPARRFAVRYRVSALDGTTVLPVEDLTRDATVHVQAEVWQVSPHLPTVIMALPDASVDANGAGVAGITDVDGNLQIPALFPGIVGATLTGPFATVRSAGTPGALRTTATSTGGDTVVTFEAPTEFLRAQTTAFLWTSVVNRWARHHLPVLGAPGTVLDRMRVTVNDPATVCNGFFDGASITLGRAGPGCQNSATPTLVAHELGHAIHYQLASGDLDGAYSEGFGDTVAALITDQPCVGAGIEGPGSCLRDLTNVTTWPVVDADVHQVGEAYGQFAWALRQAIGNAAATTNVLAAAAAAPQDIPDAVYLSFVVDDDDGLLGTCSPNQRALEAAADRQHLPRPQTCRPTGDNRSPTAVNDLLRIVEDAGVTALDLVGNDSDPDGDHLEVTNVSTASLGRVTCDRVGCTYRPNANAFGIDTFTYTAIDTFGGASTATVRVEITAVEDPLEIAGPSAVEGLEDQPIPVRVYAADPDGPAVTIRWIAGSAAAPAPCVFADPLAAATTVTCSHEGTFALSVIVTHGSTQVQTEAVPAEILNAHPSVAIVAPVTGSIVAALTSVPVVATFEEGPMAGVHRCVIDWGDGVVSTGAVAGAGCRGDHAYARSAAGVRRVTVFVVGPDDTSGSAAVDLQVTAMSATCGPGSTVTCLALGVGVLGPARAVFEFSALSIRGRSAGQWALVDGLRFRFVAVVQSLDITGTVAVMRGTGAVNGRSGYVFEAMADQRPSARDMVRLVIRDPGGVVVRDLTGELPRGAVRVAVVP